MTHAAGILTQSFAIKNNRVKTRFEICYFYQQLARPHLATFPHSVCVNTHQSLIVWTFHDIRVGSEGAEIRMVTRSSVPVLFSLRDIHFSERS